MPRNAMNWGWAAARTATWTEAKATKEPKGTSYARVIGFAHRGAPGTRAEENTIAAFGRALTTGAPGLETDIALTADGVPVLVHPRLPFTGGPRVSSLSSDNLPPDIPRLADLYEQCGADFELSLDMGEPRAADAVVRTAEQFGAVGRLWLTYWHLAQMQEWRRRWPHIRLVYPTMPLLRGRRERLIERLANAGVDVLNVHHRFLTPSLSEAVRRAGLQIFAWGIKKDRTLYRVLRVGVDGVYCDNVESMVEALARACGDEINHSGTCRGVPLVQPRWGEGTGAESDR